MLIHDRDRYFRYNVQNKKEKKKRKLIQVGR